MATNKDFRTVKTSIPCDSNVEDFKKRDNVIWTNQNRQVKNAFTPTHGWQQNFFTDNAYGTGSLTNIFSSNRDDGLRWTNQKIGAQHQNIVEVGLKDYNARWMGANIFNGFGYEVYQMGDKHAQYLTGTALVFSNGSSWRTYGVKPQDGKDDKPREGYRYIHLRDSSKINEIRNWGRAWRLTGINFWFQTDSTAGSTSGLSFYIYNLKFFHKVSLDDNAYRILIPGKRSWSQRGADYGNIYFSNPLL